MLLDSEFVATRNMLLAGEISRRQASQIVDSLLAIDDEALRLRVERKALSRAPHQTVAQTRRLLRDQLVRIDAHNGGEQTKKAQEARRVELWPNDFGMATISAQMRADHALQLMDELDRRARLAPSDDLRSMDARRSAFGRPAKPA